MRKLFVVTVLLTLWIMNAVFADSRSDPMSRPAIKAFLAEGFGERHAKAPAELAQFGRLVGLWQVETEMARRDGGWVKTNPGIWAWKYVLGGFAVSDLWFQSEDNLPPYMASLGRDYMLSANRIYDVAAKQWSVEWMSNGAGKLQMPDVGSFKATLEDGEIVMTDTAVGGGGMAGMQRVVFSEITEDSFRWSSAYSQDGGETWMTIMRMQAKRVH